MSPADCASLSDSSRMLALIEVRDCILTAIRAFFRTRGYREVTTPVLVRCPGLDHHVEALAAGNSKYLATSPELHMKRLVCAGAPLIYQIIPSFRAEEVGAHHKTEFLMLEWYHAGVDYHALMIETEDLLKHVTAAFGRCPPGLNFPVPRITVDQLYEDAAGWKPSEHWDEDRYFLDWATTVEPYLQTLPAIIIYEFPAELSALSKISSVNPKICERFELYLNGIEICNAYSELTDFSEHKKRFDCAARRRLEHGLTPYPVDKCFLKTVERGMPMCSGNALGIDRLIMACTGSEHINEVSLFCEES